MYTTLHKRRPGISFKQHILNFSQKRFIVNAITCCYVVIRYNSYAFQYPVWSLKQKEQPSITYLFELWYLIYLLSCKNHFLSYLSDYFGFINCVRLLWMLFYLFSFFFYNVKKTYFSNNEYNKYLIYLHTACNLVQMWHNS